MNTIGLIILLSGSVICAFIVLLAVIGPLYLKFSSISVLLIGLVLLISLFMILIGMKLVFKKNDEDVEYV